MNQRDLSLYKIEALNELLRDLSNEFKQNKDLNTLATIKSLLLFMSLELKNIEESLE